MTVLVSYATAAGSTRGVAERIAARLRAAGLAVDLEPVDEVPEPGAYEAVVVGSAIHGQAWLPEAARFMTTYAGHLRERELWLFSVGMPGALGKPLRRWAAQEGPKVVAPFTGLGARDTALFTGVVRKTQLPLFGRIVFRLMGGQYGDFRDWAAIDAWSDTIATALAPQSLSR